MNPSKPIKFFIALTVVVSVLWIWWPSKAEHDSGHADSGTSDILSVDQYADTHDELVLIDDGTHTGATLVSLDEPEVGQILVFNDSTMELTWTHPGGRTFATAEFCQGDEECQRIEFWCDADDRCVVSLSDMDGRERGAVIVDAEE